MQCQHRNPTALFRRLLIHVLASNSSEKAEVTFGKMLIFFVSLIFKMTSPRD